MDNRNEYVDIESALKRVGGNATLYKKLLNHFTEGNYLEPLDEALNKDDKEEATRAAHTIKGVCANLSLIKLFTASSELEQIIMNNEDYSERVAELKEIYAITSQHIAEIMEE